MHLVKLLGLGLARLKPKAIAVTHDVSGRRRGKMRSDYQNAIFSPACDEGVARCASL